MKYIRTKDGIYIPCEIKGYEDYFVCLKGNANVCKKSDLQIIKESDNIYDLIQDGDLCKLTCRLWFREVIAEIKVIRREKYLGFSVPGVEVGITNILAWWIPLSNGDFHKVAEMNEERELELL